MATVLSITLIPLCSRPLVIFLPFAGETILTTTEDGVDYQLYISMGYIDSVGVGEGLNSGVLNPYHIKKHKISITEKEFFYIHLKTLVLLAIIQNERH